MIPVYSIEEKLGLGDKVKANRITYASLVSGINKFEISEPILLRLNNAAKALASKQVDLYYLQTLLVTSGWNLNTDVFDRQELWLARNTPEDKPINYEHKGNDIIGHMTANFAVDADLKVLASDTEVDKLPGKFHILTNGVLYKFWEDKEKQDRMDKILAGIAKGEWSVSMEALFTNFDYALQTKAGNEVILRNDKTAFLTKHLRAYGGSGEYEGKKIGRLLRNIVFSGKGLVKNPANPDSKIFENVQEFDVSKSKLVYEIIDTNRETVMAENDKQVADLQRKISELETQLKDNDVKAIKAQLDAVKSDLQKRDETIVNLNKEIEDKKTLAEKLAKTEKDLGDAQKAFSGVKAELDKIQTERKKDSRVAALLEKKVEKADAVKLVETLASLTDEAWAVYLETQSKAFKVETKVETPKEPEKVLEGAKTAEAALTVSTPKVDEGFDKVQASICSYLNSDKVKGDE